MSESLPCVEAETGARPRAAVVWLHGLGADGHDFEPIVPELDLGGLAVRFVFPHAPAIPVTINGGYVMPAWYDIADVDLRRRHDEAGVRRSNGQVKNLIEREIARGIAAERIVLAGFSQGGAIALHLGLRLDLRLAGIMALSTYLIGEDTLPQEASVANQRTPIFLAHGTHDPVVVLDRGKAGHDRLLALGYDVNWRTYPMQHAVCAEELRDIGGFLRAVLTEPPHA